MASDTPAPDPAAGAGHALAERLADTVRATVLAHRRAIELGAGQLAGVTVELELKRGQVVESYVHISHAGAHRGARPA
jgi:hypothetical protein